MNGALRSLYPALFLELLGARITRGDSDSRVPSVKSIRRICIVDNFYVRAGGRNTAQLIACHFHGLLALVLPTTSTVPPACSPGWFLTFFSSRLCNFIIHRIAGIASLAVFSHRPNSKPTVAKRRLRANKAMSKAYVNLLNTVLDTCSHTPTVTLAISKISRISQSISG